MTRDAILLCTVGGSHQPILKAIESIGPAYVCFFCTGRDPDTGRPGSIVQVTGAGNIIKARFADEKPTLPNIPVQAGLGADRFESCTVPADDLDGAFLAMRTAASELARRFPGTRFVADYTGGTKTMTAALVCAALERDDVELQLVAGARPNLVRVEAGTEQAMAASVARLRLDRTMAPYLGAWRRFAYHEAAEGLEGIPVAVNAPDRGRLVLARALSRVLARWDDFDHPGALALLNTCATRLPRDWQTEMLPALRLLADESHPPKPPNPRREPARLFDLLWNARRRASQGRFDDAVARVYRLIEWTAQWQLRSRLDIDTADVPPDRLPAGVDARPDREGKVRIGLWSAWQVVAEHLDGPARSLVTGDSGAELRDLLSIRNHSILAHGFQPVQKNEWDRMQEWLQKRFLPVLESLAKQSGLKKPPPQLPCEAPASVLEFDGGD